MGNSRAMAKMLGLSMLAVGLGGGIYGGGHETPDYHSPMADDNRTQEQKWKDENAKLAKSKSKQERKYERMIKAYPNMRKEEDFI